jgi:dTDP-4-amino-4,6-dideoxygalactose transaminase
LPGLPLLLSADPRANYLAHKDEIDVAIHRVLDGGRYILGQEVAAFEQEFAGYLGVRFAVGVASGTDALHLALRVLGIGPGDAVITVSHTAVATVAAIELAGARPVLIDIDPGTFTMEPSRLAEMLAGAETGQGPCAGRSFKAIIPVHLYGYPADMPAIMEIAGRYGLYVIEDCSQSHGAAIQGRKTGGWGHMAAFSFYPTKNLGALGDGGAVTTNDPELAEKARLLREYGWRERYVSDLPGMNTRLDELQAAILRVKLQHLNSENGRRRQIAGIYDSLLTNTTLALPLSRHTVDHVYHQYVVRSTRRDALKQFLNMHSIGTSVHYPVPVHLQPAYRGRVVVGPGNLRHTERLCQEVLSLPIHPQMADGDAQRVCDVILRWHADPEDLA